jgi:hypothetical protein
MLCGCAQLLGVDDVVYRGGDGATEAMTDASSSDADVTADASPSCDGPCPPTTIVTKSGLLPTLATDGTHVFFRTIDTVWSCSTSGCANNPTALASTSTSGLEIVAAASDLVVWTDGSSVFGCAPGACGIPRTYFNFASKPVTGLAASTLSSFVLAAGGDGALLSVHRNTLDGANDAQIYSGSPGGGSPGPVAAVPGANEVYWSQVGTPTLYDCSQATCAQPEHTVGSSGGSPTALLATSKALFVVTPGGVQIASAPIASTQSFVSGAIQGVTITTTSAATIYFCEDTIIQSCSTTPPCTSAPIHTGSGITAIAADGVALYWIEGSSIMRMAL